MYLRFHVNYYSELTHKTCGIFGAIHHLKRRGVLSEEEQSLFLAIDTWFDKHLPTPPYYKLGNPDGAITWFKNPIPTAMDIKLQQLREIAERHDIRIYLTESDSPGRIIYEDDYQIAVL